MLLVVIVSFTSSGCSAAKTVKAAFKTPNRRVLVYQANIVDNQMSPIKGVTFGIYNSKGTYFGEASSGKDGKLSLYVLKEDELLQENGNLKEELTVKCISCPKDYILPPESSITKVTKETIVLPNTTYELCFEVGTNGNPVPDITIEVTADGGTETLVTSSEGIATINLQRGTYTYKIVSMPGSIFQAYEGTVTVNGNCVEKISVT